jgi:hypothetical protein
MKSDQHYRYWFHEFEKKFWNSQSLLYPPTPSGSRHPRFAMDRCVADDRLLCWVAPILRLPGFRQKETPAVGGVPAGASIPILGETGLGVTAQGEKRVSNQNRLQKVRPGACGQVPAIINKFLKITQNIVLINNFIYFNAPAASYLQCLPLPATAHPGWRRRPCGR